MAESNATLDYDDFANAVSYFLGHGLTIPASGDKKTLVDRYVQSGLRRFYAAYHWSFLRPQSLALSLADEGTSVVLPDDFGGLAGDISISTSETDTLVRMMGEQQMRRKRQFDSTTVGRPQFCAIYTAASPAGAALGQVWTLEVWPTADVAYTLGMSYRLNPTLIDDTTNKFPLGGQTHGETMMEFMLAVAELEGNDDINVHEQKSQQLLQGSIEHDRRYFGANSLGKIPDASRVTTSARTFSWSRV